MSGGAREQVSRLLALAPYLQRRGGVRLATVADDFGVPPAQIVKDLKVLWMCGLPGLGPGDLIDIEFEPFEDDPDGIVRIGNAEYLDHPVRLGSSEASALVVALRALREGSSPESGEVIDRVLAKLDVALAGGERAPVEVHLPARRSRDDATRATVQQAIDQDRQLRMGYYVPTRDETTQRIVDPIAVLSRDGKEYIDAWCHLVEGRRLFRLDRVQVAEVLDAPRTKQQVEPRDLAAGLFEPGPDDLEARLRLAPGARWVADYYPTTSVGEAPDGALDVTLLVGDPRWLTRLALRLAPEVTILEPAASADEVTEAARSALALYPDA